MVAGARFLATSDVVRPILVTCTTLNFFSFAVVALSLGGHSEWRAMRRRAETYAARARHHADLVAVLRSIAARDGEEAPVDVSPGPGARSVLFPLRVVAAHEDRLRRKYERAARYPWLPVPPDPPEPE